jgi:integral membrane sensor domain MASE1
LWAVVISLIYSAAAAFLRKRIHYDWHLRKLRDVIWFVLTAVLVSALLAILSVSSSALSSNMPRSEVLRAIFDWWIGETIGVLTITPFLLLFVIPALKRFMEGRPISLHIDWSFQRPSLTTIGQAFSIILALYLVFGVHLLDQYQPLYLISLPLIWVALSRGLKGISVAILALNTGVVG